MTRPPTGAVGPDASAARELRSAAAFVFVEDLDTLELDPGDAHHLLDVLRVSPAEPLVACDGHGAWRPCVLRATSGGTGDGSRTGRHGRSRSGSRDGASGCMLEATGPTATTGEPSRRLTIGFAMTKGDRPEWTVQKLTELGIDRIWPLITARTVVRLTPAEATRRGDRLRRVAREAASQSRRTRLPEVADPLAFGDALTSLADRGRSVLLAEPGGGLVDGSTSTVLVGPEGGWDPGELGCGAEQLGLGGSVLRAETAAIVAGALLSALRAGAVHAP